MKTIYLNIFSGISGDMFIGAMIDLGVDFKQLDKELEKLGLHDYHLHLSRRKRISKGRNLMFVWKKITITNTKRITNITPTLIMSMLIHTGIVILRARIMMTTTTNMDIIIMEMSTNTNMSTAGIFQR